MPLFPPRIGPAVFSRDRSLGAVLAVALASVGACVPKQPEGEAMPAPATGGRPVTGTGGAAAPAGSGGAGGSAPAEPTPGGSGGASAGTGGTPAMPGEPDAATMNADAAGPADAAEREAPPEIMVTPPTFPPITQCPEPAVDRLRQFLAWSGSTMPPTGSNVLAKEGDKNIAKITFVACKTWCELVLPFTNSLAGQVDFTKSAGFSMTYSAMADLWVQLRPASKYHGGDKWVIKIPATAGKVEERFFPFLPQAWFWLNRLGKPNYPFEEALKDARSFDFVVNTENALTIKSLRFDGYVPPCK